MQQSVQGMRARTAVDRAAAKARHAKRATNARSDTGLRNGLHNAGQKRRRSVVDRARRRRQDNDARFKGNSKQLAIVRKVGAVYLLTQREYTALWRKDGLQRWVAVQLHLPIRAGDGKEPAVW